MYYFYRGVADEVRAAKLADKYKGGNVDIPGVATLTAEKPLFNMEKGVPKIDSSDAVSSVSSEISSSSSSSTGSGGGRNTNSQDNSSTDNKSSNDYHVLFHKTLEVDVGLSWELAVEKQRMLSIQLEEEEKVKHGNSTTSTLEAVFFIRRSPSAAHGRAQPSLAVVPNTRPKNGDVKIRGEPACTSAVYISVYFQCFFLLCL